MMDKIMVESVEVGDVLLNSKAPPIQSKGVVLAIQSDNVVILANEEAMWRVWYSMPFITKQRNDKKQAAKLQQKWRALVDV
jgi:hypothetical protein